jgi:hypothetical protein
MAKPPLQSANAALTAPCMVPLELTWFLAKARRAVTAPFLADIISTSESRKSVWMRRQQLLVRGCFELITINWTVSLHTLPDPSYMIQFG